MIKIYISHACSQEKQYILEVVFKEWLGLEHVIIVENRRDYKILLPNGKFFNLPDVFLGMNDASWLTLKTLPLSSYKADILFQGLCIKNSVDIIFGKKGTSDLSLDIFGTIFYLITCYEEAVIKNKDSHGRFDYKDSAGFKFNFIEKPLANIYLEILWECLKILSPDLRRKKREYRLDLSHDVDRPFSYLFSPPKRIITEMGRSLIHHKNIWGAINQPLNYIAVKNGNDRKDPFYTFDWIMDQSDAHNIASTFYFLADRTCEHDGDYAIDHPRIKKLIKRIHDRGHVTGLHGSYNSYNNIDQITKEYQAFQAVRESLGIQTPLQKSRQHYLRWDITKTPQILKKAGIEQDATLTHAAYIGFRCGTCYEFPMYDLVAHKKIDLWQHPLIVMEGTMLSEKYMGLDLEKSLKSTLNLKNQCKQYAGTFSLLWHNTELLSNERQKSYMSILG